MNVTITPIAEPDMAAHCWSEFEANYRVSPFQSWLWMGPWLERALQACEVWMISVRFEESLVGLGIATRRTAPGKRLFPVKALYLNEAGPGVLDFCVERNGLLIKPGQEKEVSMAVLHALVHAEFEWDELHIRRASTHDALIDLRQLPAGLDITSDDDEVSRHVDLDQVRGSGTDYMQTLSRSRQKKLRRELRILNRHGTADVTVAANSKTGNDFLDQLKKFHQIRMQRKGEHGAFSHTAFEAFHRDLIDRHTETGRVQLLRISAGSIPIGFIYSLVHDKVVSVMQTGFDYDTIPELRPGEVSHYLAIEWNLLRGHTAYDFLAGDSFYKKTLSNQHDVMTNIIVQKPKIKLRIERMAKQLKRATESGVASMQRKHPLFWR